MKYNVQCARKIFALLLAIAAGRGVSHAQAVYTSWPPPPPQGPYALGYGVPGAGGVIDEPIPGFVGPAGDGAAPYAGDNLEQQVNPVFVEWASSVANYSPANPKRINAAYLDPVSALGPVTGNVFDVASLGDLSATDIAIGVAPGALTLGFDKPIADGPGADFVVFGNAFGVHGNAAAQVFSKLAFVEVSSDGVNFVRFPSVDLNPRPKQKPWSFMVSNPTLIYNLFGKAINAYGQSWGVPFDLNQLSTHPLVVAGLIDLQNIRFVRFVAVVGNGSYSSDAYGNPIYDPWPTSGSPGPEIQAVGVINMVQPPPPKPSPVSSRAKTAPAPAPAFTGAKTRQPSALEKPGSTQAPVHGGAFFDYASPSYPVSEFADLFSNNYGNGGIVQNESAAPNPIFAAQSLSSLSPALNTFSPGSNKTQPYQSNTGPTSIGSVGNQVAGQSITGFDIKHNAESVEDSLEKPNLNFRVDHEPEFKLEDDKGLYWPLAKFTVLVVGSISGLVVLLRTARR